uniref:Uncharacterized protein n=1 Tax=Panagrolaimus superbus TaxID=310955 RepID=A0A914YQA9_9BILA
MKSIQTIVTKMIEKTSDIVENFFSNPSIKDLIDAIKTSLRCKGITYQTVINGIAKQIFDKDIDPLFFKIGIYIVTEFKKLISNENIVNQNSPSNNKAQQLLNGIEKILTSEIFKNFMVLLQAKLKAIEKQLIKRCKNELLEDVQSKEGVDISLDKASIFKVDENQMFTETVENAMTQWSNELKEKTKDAFETKVKLVLNSANEKNFQSKLNSIILGAYADFRKDQKKRSEIGKKIQKIPSNLAEENLMIQFKKDYFFKLGELQTKTCNPSHYVAAILETANIDEYGGNVISQLISEKLYKTVIVKNEDKFIKPDEIIITPNGIFLF